MKRSRRMAGASAGARVGAIKAALSSGGLAFQSRSGQSNALKRVAIEVRPHDVAVTLRDFVRPGWRGEWTPTRAALYRRQRAARRRGARSEPPLRLRRSAGRLGEARYPHFRGLRALELSLVPVSPPKEGVVLLGRSGFLGGRRQKLDARFGPNVPTDSERQSVHIDAERRLVAARLHCRAHRLVGDRREPLSRERGRRGDTLLYAAKGVSAPRTAKDGRPISTWCGSNSTSERRLRRSR